MTVTGLRMLRAALLLVGLSTLYLLTANFTLRQSFDTISTALPAWQLAHHHNLDLTAFQGWSDWIIPIGHHWVSNRFPGATFFAAPFYLLQGSGGSAPALWPAALAAVVSVTAAVALLYQSLRDIAPRLGLLMAAAFALGTPAWSVAADALWTHGPALFALSLVLVGLSRNKPALTSVGLVLAILCRPHLGVAGLVIALYMALRSSERSWRILPVLGLVVGTALLLAYNAIVYGHFSLLGGYAASNAPVGGVGLTGLPPNLLGALVSPSRGLLIYTPVLLVLLPFSRWAWRQSPPWIRAAGLGGLAYLAVQLYLVRFTGGNRFYSYRVTLEGLFLCWPLLTVAAGRLSGRAGRGIFATSAALSVAITGVGALTNFVSVQEIRPWQQFDLQAALRQLTAGQACVVLGLGVVMGILTWRTSAPNHSGDPHAAARRGLVADDPLPPARRDPGEPSALGTAKAPIHTTGVRSGI